MKYILYTANQTARLIFTEFIVLHRGFLLEKQMLPDKVKTFISHIDNFVEP